MKRQSLLACSVACLGFSLSGYAQKQSPINADVRSAANRPGNANVFASINPSDLTTLARNAGPDAGSAPESTALPTAPEPLLTAQYGAKLAKQETTIPSRTQIRIWKGLALADHSAALFDAWSTRESLTSGNGYERDPLMKPFASSAAIYPMLQIVPFGTDYLARRFMRSNHLFLRRIWWVPQAAVIGSSMWSGARNLHVADLKR